MIRFENFYINIKRITYRSKRKNRQLQQNISPIKPPNPSITITHNHLIQSSSNRKSFNYPTQSIHNANTYTSKSFSHTTAAERSFALPPPTAHIHTHLRAHFSHFPLLIRRGRVGRDCKLPH